MGLNWSEGLARVGEGLGQLGNYYARREDMERDEKARAADRAFQMNLERVRQMHAEKIQGAGFEQAKLMQDDNQDFIGTENVAMRGHQTGLAESERLSREKMHGESLSVAREGHGIQREGIIAQREDRAAARAEGVMRHEQQMKAFEQNARSLEITMQNAVNTGRQQSIAMAQQTPEYQNYAALLKASQESPREFKPTKLVDGVETPNPQFQRLQEAQVGASISLVQSGAYGLSPDQTTQVVDLLKRTSETGERMTINDAISAVKQMETPKPSTFSADPNTAPMPGKVNIQQPPW